MTPHLAPYVLTGGLIFLSGQIAFGEDGTVAGDVASQTTFCLEKLSAELARQGLAPSSIVKTTVWLSSKDDFGAFDTAYAAFFGDHRPARSTVVAELVAVGALVEIEAIASSG